MATLYVAASKGLSGWGADIGLTKHIYKVGVADGPADAIVDALNGEEHAGHGDWRLLKKQLVDALDEATAIERLARCERIVDPTLYPRIRGAQGLFKVKVANVANHLLVKRALADEDAKLEKVKAGDVAAYLIENAMN